MSAEAPYNGTARGYLVRARQQLDGGTMEGIFYAALELRCGVEQRLWEYLQAQRHVSQKIRHGWKIAKMGQRLEVMFRTGNKVVQFRVSHRPSGQHIRTLYYTPVTNSLRKKAEQMGDILHAMRDTDATKVDWWERQNDLLEAAYTELEQATRGRLLGVPIINRDTKKLFSYVELGDDDNEGARDLGFIAGDNVILDVKYLDQMPQDRNAGV